MKSAKKWHEDVIISQIKSFVLHRTPHVPGWRGKKYTTLWQYQGRQNRYDVTITCSHVFFFFFYIFLLLFFFLNSFCHLVNCSYSCKNRKRKRGTVWTGGGRYIVTGLFGELSCSLAFFSSLALQERQDERQESGQFVLQTHTHACVRALFYLQYFIIRTYAAVLQHSVAEFWARTALEVFSLFVLSTIGSDMHLL